MKSSTTPVSPTDDELCALCAENGFSTLHPATIQELRHGLQYFVDELIDKMWPVTELMYHLSPIQASIEEAYRLLGAEHDKFRAICHENIYHTEDSESEWNTSDASSTQSFEECSDEEQSNEEKSEEEEDDMEPCCTYDDEINEYTEIPEEKASSHFISLKSVRNMIYRNRYIPGIVHSALCALRNIVEDQVVFACQDELHLLPLQVKTGKVEASASLRVIDYVHRMQEKEKSIAASESAETVACPSDELQEKAINAVQLNSENVSELVAVLQRFVAMKQPAAESMDVQSELDALRAHNLKLETDLQASRHELVQYRAWAQAMRGLTEQLNVTASQSFGATPPESRKRKEAPSTPYPRVKFSVSRLSTESSDESFVADTPIL